MKVLFLTIEKTSRGLRPVVIGQPDDHIMDWRGCSFHKAALPGWPRGKRLVVTDQNIQLLKALIQSIALQPLQARLLGIKGQWSGDNDPTIL